LGIFPRKNLAVIHAERRRPQGSADIGNTKPESGQDDDDIERNADRENPASGSVEAKKDQGQRNKIENSQYRNVPVSCLSDRKANGAEQRGFQQGRGGTKGSKDKTEKAQLQGRQPGALNRGPTVRHGNLQKRPYGNMAIRKIGTRKPGRLPKRVA
jgi:hypothetical protein